MKDKKEQPDDFWLTKVFLIRLALVSILFFAVFEIITGSLKGGMPMAMAMIASTCIISFVLSFWSVFNTK